MEEHAGGRILYRVESPASYILINRPEKRNAMTYEMWRALSTLYERACNDESVRVVVLRGRGGAFSAGDDIGEMRGLETIADSRVFFEALGAAFKSVIGCPKITVAVVEGPAVGGGGEILLAMDYVIASKSSYTGYTEIHIGLIPPILSTLGVYLLGVRNVKKLALTGRIINAEEALKLGIFDEVVDESEIEGALRRIVNLSLQLPVEAVKSIKRVVNESVRPAYEYGLSELIQLSLTSEAKHRMGLFLEKKLVRPT